MNNFYDTVGDEPLDAVVKKSGKADAHFSFGQLGQYPAVVVPTWVAVPTLQNRPPVAVACHSGAHHLCG